VRVIYLLVAPAVYEAYDEVTENSSEEVFILRSNDGLITRMEGNLAKVVRLQETDAPWFGDSNNLTMYTNAVETLKSVIIPDFKLENKTFNGRPELYLIDTYRNITRRYRSWMENGHRRERFEIVK